MLGFFLVGFFFWFGFFGLFFVFFKRQRICSGMLKPVWKVIIECLPPFPQLGVDKTCQTSCLASFVRSPLLQGLLHGLYFEMERGEVVEGQFASFPLPVAHTQCWYPWPVLVPVTVPVPGVCTALSPRCLLLTPKLPGWWCMGPFPHPITPSQRMTSVPKATFFPLFLCPVNHSDFSG